VALQVENLPSTLMGFLLGIELGYGLNFVASFFILFYIRERVSKFKHLQFVSGVNATIFWGISFLSDLITYAVIAAAVVITMAALQEDGYKTPGELGRSHLTTWQIGKLGDFRATSTCAHIFWVLRPSLLIFIFISDGYSIDWFFQDDVTRFNRR
jgi:hypothetical protein